MWFRVKAVNNMNHLDVHVEMGSNSDICRKSVRLRLLFVSLESFLCLIDSKSLLLQFIFVHSPLTHGQN